MVDYILLIISTALINNFVLVKFLGLCPFMGVVNIAYAGCYNGKQTAYFVKNGKLTKQQVDYDTCGNMSGGFESWTFKNGKLSIGAEDGQAYQLLEGKTVERVSNPTGIPSGFECYISPANRKEVYCVESGQ